MTIAKIWLATCALCFLGCGAKSKPASTIPIEREATKQENLCSAEVTTDTPTPPEADACSDEGYPPDDWDD